MHFMHLLVLSLSWRIFHVEGRECTFPSAGASDEVCLQDEVNSLKHHLVELEERLAQLDTKTSRSSEEIMRRIDVTEMPRDKLSDNVAFYAMLGRSYADIGAWEVIKFTNVQTNIGGACGAYDASTGVFTVPVSGTYVFHAHILCAAKKSIETALKVNGKVKLLLYSGGTTSFYGSGSNLGVFDLQVGDTVTMVKNGPWGTRPFYIHAAWSTFSGFLLRPN